MYHRNVTTSRTTVNYPMSVGTFFRVDLIDLSIVRFKYVRFFT
jgi:hypothetical protein